MKRLSRSVALIANISLLPFSADASGAEEPYTNDLSKCLVRSTSESDKSLLVQWMFATASLHPDVKWMTVLTESQRADLNKRTAALFERVLTHACVDEARQAVKYEGERALSASFNVLGQVAARELFANPAVASGLAELGKQIDSEKLKRDLGLAK